jgi:hypothetical protein
MDPKQPDDADLRWALHTGIVARPIGRLPILYAEDHGQLRRIAGALRSSELTRVKYAVPREGSWQGSRPQENVDEIDDGVQLLTKIDGVVVRWAMAGANEGLYAGLLSQTKRDPDPALLRQLDVSELPQWKPFLTKPLMLRGMASHVPFETDRATVWSLRFETSDGAKVVIALGEWTETGLQYLPDGLVAIFDEAVARGFTIPDNPGSAWGEYWR